MMTRSKKADKSLKPGIPLTVPYDKPQPGMMKIGEVAEDLGISVQVIRLYEAEGLLISFKSAKGTRWYSRDDVKWIEKIRDLVSEGLNFAGIRRLLALIPCWALKPCRPEDHANCAMRYETRFPCWIAPEKLCTEKLKECYHCNTYRKAREFVELKTKADIVPLEL
jgi:MerR family transcriptional regulator/heat shock protein HspR